MQSGYSREDATQALMMASIVTTKEGPFNLKEAATSAQSRGNLRSIAIQNPEKGEVKVQIVHGKAHNKGDSHKHEIGESILEGDNGIALSYIRPTIMPCVLMYNFLRPCWRYQSLHRRERRGL